jgi:hypothetical protein
MQRIATGVGWLRDTLHEALAPVRHGATPACPGTAAVRTVDCQEPIR